jgi:heme-degrading monooxygenase HmoA
MAILVTMQVGPVDWAKFKSALDWGLAIPAPGRKYSHVYRAQNDPSRVLIVEEWDSHDAMHRYQDGSGEEFNRRAGTEGMEWQDQVWELADALQ